jgi:hypothetical protein
MGIECQPLIFTAAFFEFLTRTAGARIIPADFWFAPCICNWPCIWVVILIEKCFFLRSYAQHFLNFLPDPQGQGSFLPTFISETTCSMPSRNSGLGLFPLAWASAFSSQISMRIFASSGHSSSNRGGIGNPLSLVNFICSSIVETSLAKIDETVKKNLTQKTGHILSNKNS